MRATLDTNAFVSALNFGGVPEQILDLHTDEKFVLCISPAIIDEIRRILADRFEWPEKSIVTALEPILSRAVTIEPKLMVAVCADPDDNHILACGIDSQSDFIVTGEDHLLRLGEFDGIRIVKPREFLDIIRIKLLYKVRFTWRKHTISPPSAARKPHRRRESSPVWLE
ncbi:MAG TPA: putative toxin-antitoxin system toxin component, PIN family [Bryobacteraceae bacterium]|nr:putative toxin-antitoxin system toxin component, PIN family [Bryobacteraceae bacterium]